MREPSILLFDLGAVLIDISFDRVFASWSEAGNRSAADLKARFSMEASYEAHERGHIHSTEYWQALRNLLGLDLSDHDFERGWNEVFQGEITEVTSLLPRLDLPLYVFSNTNRVHQDRFESAYADAHSVPCSLHFERPWRAQARRRGLREGRRGDRHTPLADSVL